MKYRTFWALVKNDLKLSKSHKSRYQGWWKIYVLSVLLVGLGFYLYGLVNNLVRPQYLLFFMPYLLFFAYSAAHRHIRQEWRGQTAGWWLSLPYARGMLLGAKFTSVFLRFLRSLSRFLVLMVSLALIGMVLKPDFWNLVTLTPVILSAAKLALLLILASPAVIAFGLCFAILRQSRWRILLPVLILMAIFMVNVLMNNFVHMIIVTVNSPDFIMLPQLIPVYGLKDLLIFGVTIPWLIAICFFGMATYLLGQQTEL